jgi:hypothetical protein
MDTSGAERRMAVAFDSGDSSGSRKYFSSAWKFWEPKRAVYNLILAIFVVGWIVVTWPHFRPAFNWGDFGRLLILAAIANVCFSAAYILDLLAQQISKPSAMWAIRWTTFCVGMALAALLTNYWIADEIYPFVH